MQMVGECAYRRITVILLQLEIIHQIDVPFTTHKKLNLHL